MKSIPMQKNIFHAVNQAKITSYFQPNVAKITQYNINLNIHMYDTKVSHARYRNLDYTI